VTSNRFAVAGHPLALWLHRVAENLDTIFVRYRDEEAGNWESRSLADIPEVTAAFHVAEFLQRWPFIPMRVLRDRPSEYQSGPLTLEELKAALHRERAIVQHFQQIRDRVFGTSSADRESADSSGAHAASTAELLVDAAALVGYLQLALDENERLVAFLAGLQEAGTISREELEFLMGLRHG
jgi:hypothetical protein